MRAFAVQTSPRPISLATLLASRDCRQRRQQQWLKRDCALISLTLVMPGAIKDNALARRLFNIACQQIEQVLASYPLTRLQRWRALLHSGPEALWLVRTKGDWLKTVCCQLEEQHPLGRLWDIDVIADDGRPLPRSTLGKRPRQCLLCQQHASVCVRARQHSVAQLQQKMREMLNGYLLE